MTNKIKHQFLILTYLFLISSSLTCAQNPFTDSLENLLELSNCSTSVQYLSTIDKLFEEYHFQGNDDQSKFYAELLIQKSERFKSETYLMKGKLNKAWISFKTNREHAKKTTEELLDRVQKTGDKLIEAECYFLLGTYYKHQKSGLTYFKKAIEIFRNLNSLREIDVTAQWVIIDFNNIGYQESLKKLNKVYSKAKKANQPALILKTLAPTLFFQYQLALFEEASHTAHQALKIALDNNYHRTKELVRIYSISANLFYEVGDYDEALKQAELAYETSKHVNDVSSKAKGAIRLAHYYTELVPEKYDKAEQLLQFTIDLAKEHNLFTRNAFALFNYGNLLAKKGQPKAAVKKYFECLEFIKKNTSTRQIKEIEISTKAAITLLLYKLPNNTELQHIENSLSTVGVDSLTLHSKELYYELKKNIAYQKNNYNEAFLWLEKEVEIKDSIQIALHKNDIQQLHLKNQLENEKEFNIKNQELLSKKNLINKLLILLSILFLALISFQFLSQKTRKKHHKEILEKNKKISSAMNQISQLNISLNEKNELLEQKNEVKNKELLEFATFKAAHDEQLKNIKSSFDDLSKKQSVNPVDLKLIESKLRDLQAEEDEHWISFKQKIEDAFPHFFSNLALKHPGLTKREKFHCGYVLIGMTVKAVAKISFVTPTTVNSARYRMKKKLGLTKADHLKSYLIKISQTSSKDSSTS